MVSRFTKISNAIQAPSNQYDTGLLSGLQSGIKAYTGLRGGIEDEKTALLDKQAKLDREDAIARQKQLDALELQRLKNVGQASEGTGSLAGSGVNLGGKFDETFQKETAKDVAEQRSTVEKAGLLVDRVAQDKAAIGDFLKTNKDLIGPFSGAKSFAGKYLPFGQTLGGFNEQEQGQRGGLIRRVNNVGTSLVGIATAAGQSGINVQAEIDRITKGINEGATSAEITSALDELEKQVIGDLEGAKRSAQSTVDKFGTFKQTGKFEQPGGQVEQASGNDYSKYGLD